MSELHNPDNLTPEQYGASERYRLLNKDEVIYTPLFKGGGRIHAWRNGLWNRGEWICGNSTGWTYRTRLTPAELRKARDLPPLEEPKPALTEQQEANLRASEAYKALSEGKEVEWLCGGVWINMRDWNLNFQYRIKPTAPALRRLTVEELTAIVGKHKACVWYKTSAGNWNHLKSSKCIDWIITNRAAISFDLRTWHAPETDGKTFAGEVLV